MSNFGIPKRKSGFAIPKKKSTFAVPAPKTFKRPSTSFSFKPTERKNAKTEISKLSDFTYKLNKTLRDINAVQKGKIGERVLRRIMGNLSARGMGSVFDRLKK